MYPDQKPLERVPFIFHPCAGAPPKSLTWEEPVRLYRLMVDQPSVNTQARYNDAHHLRFAQSRTLGRKVSDEFTVPLCRGHHREIHRAGNEVAWWKKVGVDPTVLARALWLESHPLLAASGDEQSREEPDQRNGKTKPFFDVGPQ